MSEFNRPKCNLFLDMVYYVFTINRNYWFLFNGRQANTPIGPFCQLTLFYSQCDNGFLFINIATNHVMVCFYNQRSLCKAEI